LERLAQGLVVLNAPQRTVQTGLSVVAGGYCRDAGCFRQGTNEPRPLFLPEYAGALRITGAWRALAGPAERNHRRFYNCTSKTTGLESRPRARPADRAPKETDTMLEIAINWLLTVYYRR
jgi:hypothetical protein